MKTYTRKVILTLCYLLLTAGNALAASNDANNAVSHLGPFADIGGDFQTLIFWLAIFVAVISLLAIWITGNVARATQRIQAALDSRKNKEGWVVDAFIVLLGFIFLFSYVLPKLSDLMGVK